ncbi:NADH-quinone oxidoreductase subunit E [Streptomyces aidingensis]|uniref:NADH-quinone oxidoreductase subunit E n=2 Tax=Streptomyces aidingensis TaxID=910347 RepID=A0A1I1E2V6_9ACTN|nr:NADH-quinone oxidoreductase subunit E [Streptomyces aidingensis]
MSQPENILADAAAATSGSTSAAVTERVALGMPELPAPPFPAETLTRLERDAAEIIGRYPHSRSALLPLLHLVQSEEGFVSRTGMQFCADRLGLTLAEVTAVATFYSMYRRRPGGEYHVGVCTNTLCAVMGGDAIFEALQQHLGIGNGETTADGKVTLEHIECNAACDYAPVIMVNWEFFDDQTIESARQLVDDLIAGRGATPTRGAPLCGFKATSRILAGFPDRREGALEAGGSGGHASLIGLRLAKGETGPERITARPAEPAPRDVPVYPPDQAPAGHPSSHDAPQPSAGSDPDHPAGPVSEERE